MLSALVMLLLIGAFLYLLNTVAPIDQRIKTIVNVVVIMVVLIWLIQQVFSMGHVRLH